MTLGYQKKVLCTLFSVGKKVTITGAHNKGHTTLILSWCRDVFTYCDTFRRVPVLLEFIWAVSAGKRSFTKDSINGMVRLMK